MHDEFPPPTDALTPLSPSRTDSPSGAPPPQRLIDKYGRHVNYIRLSVTDRCDFRCTYCMAEEMTFLPRSEILSLEECERVARCFVGLGVTKVRITGGEPLVRNGIFWLLERISAMPGLRELVMTTNGSQLERHADQLRSAGVSRLNISLDSLQPDRFQAITRVGSLEKVLRGIDAACQAGFSRIKLNTVMMRGVNDDEFADLVRFALEKGIDITFIEEMPLGDVGHGRRGTYISSDEALATLRGEFALLPSSETTGGPARYWQLAEQQTRVGFISPHSHNFCGSCNRVRITAKGELYPCLGQNDAVALLPVLRAGDADGDRALREAIVETMGIKPLGHDFTAQMDQPQVIRYMSMTGG